MLLDLDYIAWAWEKCGYFIKFEIISKKASRSV